MLSLYFVQLSEKGKDSLKDYPQKLTMNQSLDAFIFSLFLPNAT